MGSYRGLVISGVLAIAAVALAQPKPNADQLKQAGELVHKAIAKSQAGDHVLAIELYQQAYNVVPNSILLSNIGSEYQQAGKSQDALKYFCKYLDADPTGASADYARTQAKTLSIQLNLPSDDKGLCKPPKVVPVVTTNTGTGSGGGSAIEPPPGGAGAGSGSAGGAIEPPPTGTGSGTAVTGTVGLGSAEPTPAPEPNHLLRNAGFGVAGVGVLSVGIGIYYGLKAKSLNDQINNHCPAAPMPCPAWPSSIDGVPIAQWDTTGKDWNQKTVIFTVAGGIVGLAGAAMIYFGREKPAETEQPVTIAPTASPSSIGLAASGRF